MSGTLTVVGTPIGNLGDLAPRALEVLKSADVIAAEDTRTTALLLSQYGITGATILPNHKFNEQHTAGMLVEKLISGANVALVTDAGMPCISDPGYLLVQAAVNADVPVTVVPGACAAVAAIAVSGFNALSFSFYGFLPRAGGDLKKVLRRVGTEYARLSVFYESPNRIVSSLRAVEEVLPDVSVCVCNDLTKKFEKIYRGTPAQVREALEENPNASKGEYVLLLYREAETSNEEDVSETPSSPELALVARMLRDSCSVKEAIASLTGEGAFAKNALYEASLRLKKLF